MASKRQLKAAGVTGLCTVLGTLTMGIALVCDVMPHAVGLLPCAVPVACEAASASAHAAPQGSGHEHAPQAPESDCPCACHELVPVPLAVVATFDSPRQGPQTAVSAVPAARYGVQAPDPGRGRADASRSDHVQPGPCFPGTVALLL